MAAQLSDTQLKEVLTSSQALLREFKMKTSVQFIGYLLNEFERSEIIYSYLNVTFKNLQKTLEYEFGTNEYRKRIFAYLNKRVRVAMISYIDKVKEMNAAPEIHDVIFDRVNAFRIIGKLSKMLESSSKSEFERLLGLSYSYAATVEGVYKRSVQDCYVWERLGTGALKNNTFSAIHEMDIPKVVDYFDRCFIEKSIFEGYDDIVRNAIAHSTIYFDENTNKMTYKDKRSQREVSYDFDGLQEKYQKLWDVYQMVLVKNQLLRISDACVEFLNRKRSKRFA
ncbi:hypothetical protein [Nitrososphaera sp.]|uniref:hypothetical protein n=1 Tax=Nitrososphaera sp. TaxID=1971748 RepID=UPI003180BF9F